MGRLRRILLIAVRSGEGPPNRTYNGHSGPTTGTSLHAPFRSFAGTRRDRRKRVGSGHWHRATRPTFTAGGVVKAKSQSTTPRAPLAAPLRLSGRGYRSLR